MTCSAIDGLTPVGDPNASVHPSARLNRRLGIGPCLVRRPVRPARARLRPLIARLAIVPAYATIALKFESALELLISVMLSAQTTDVSVNKVTATLFQKYRRPEDKTAGTPEGRGHQRVFGHRPSFGAGAGYPRQCRPS